MQSDVISHGSLFSGIGGFDLAAQWMGWNNIFQCEKDEWCRKVLAKNFPKTKRFEDIKDFNAKEYNGTIDVISGGFPCQPFSVAGKRKGKEDDRYLWDEMLRIIGEVQPRFVVGENVTGIIGMALDTVLSDLEAQNYTTETYIIPACGKNAWHKRERVWIVSYSESKRTRELRNKSNEEGTQNSIKLSGELCGVFPNTNGKRGCSRETWEQDAANVRKSSFSKEYWNWDFEPELGRVANGIPKRVDRLRGLGNAIVPQIAYEIFCAIQAVN